MPMIKKGLPKNLVEMLNLSTAINPEKNAMYFMDKKITYRVETFLLLQTALLRD